MLSGFFRDFVFKMKFIYYEWNSFIKMKFIFYKKINFRIRGRHKWKFSRYSVPIGPLIFFLAGTRYSSVPKIFLLAGTQRYSDFQNFDGYRSRRPLFRIIMKKVDPKWGFSPKSNLKLKLVDFSTKKNHLTFNSDWNDNEISQKANNKDNAK